MFSIFIRVPYCIRTRCLSCYSLVLKLDSTNRALWDFLIMFLYLQNRLTVLFRFCWIWQLPLIQLTSSSPFFPTYRPGGHAGVSLDWCRSQLRGRTFSVCVAKCLAHLWFRKHQWSILSPLFIYFYLFTMWPVLHNHAVVFYFYVDDSETLFCKYVLKLKLRCLLLFIYRFLLSVFLVSF